jgi:LmbE family N-acetylglucosaminyl deacetylase
MILCLSPHLDDAILSCGAQLFEQRQCGRAVKVLNIFTATGAQAYRSRPLGFRAQTLRDERQQEEQTAMGLLGLESQALDFLDAPFRDPRYRAYHHLMGPLSPQEDGLVATITARIRTLVSRWQPTLILAPLAVGLHVDHQITHAVGQRLAPDYPVAYYEDLPYSLAPYALWRRIPDPQQRPDWRKLRAASYRYYAQHPVYRALPRWQQTLAWWGIRTWLWQQGHKPVRAATETFIPKILPSSAAALDAKVRAIAAYRSQFQRMFHSPEHCRQQLSEYAHSLSEAPYSERIWRPATALGGQR